MSRLQKKCFVASTGIHLLLVVILFVGSGFFSAPKQPEIQELTFIPAILLANGPSGGGTPKVGPPPVAPPTPVTPPAKATTQEKIKDPDPPKDMVKETKQTKTAVESYETKRKLTAQDLRVVSHNDTSKKSVKKSSTSDDQEQREANARKQASDLIRQTAWGMKEGLSSVTDVKDPGPGGGGPSYASYAAWVQSVYMNAWLAPENSTTESAVAEAVVTITSDGTVKSSHVRTKSGDGQIDLSVERTLKRVTTMGRPFPEGMKDEERTYILQFDIRIKKGLA